MFVDESGTKEKRIKRLGIMDQDGANVRYLTNGKDLVLTPRFSPSRQEITYMSYEGGKPQIYLLQLETGQRELVGNFPGMTIAPRFSPDGQKVVMSSLQEDGQCQCLCDGSAQPHDDTSDEYFCNRYRRILLARWNAGRVRV